MSAGGTHILRHTGMFRPNGLLFHQKSLDMGPILVKKVLRESPISQKFAKKNVKSAVFEAEKPLEMGLDFQNVLKNCLFSRFVFLFLFLFFF